MKTFVFLWSDAPKDCEIPPQEKEVYRRTKRPVGSFGARIKKPRTANITAENNRRGPPIGDAKKGRMPDVEKRPENLRNEGPTN
jgi:hypothetical protein